MKNDLTQKSLALEMHNVILLSYHFAMMKLSNVKVLQLHLCHHSLPY